MSSTRSDRQTNADIASDHEVRYESGFNEVAARHLALFAYNVAKKFLRGRHHLIEEAVQETLTRTAERWEQALRHEKPEAWVVITATRVCLEKLREEQRGARTTQDRFVDPGPDQVTVTSLVLAEALAQLTDRQRLVVVCRYLFDHSIEQTAQELGLAESQVRDRAHRGIAKLRRILGPRWLDLP